jgi:hypothetical protein
MVSSLGFKRILAPDSILPETPRSIVPPPRETCGTELTVSVSTIIFLTEASPNFPREALNEEKDRFGMIAPGL